MKKLMHAWFSQEAADKFGSWGMYLISGQEVRITCVGNTFSKNASYYLWPDKVYLGLVDRDTYHDYWRGDEEERLQYYDCDSYGGYRAYTRIIGSWTNKRHSVESRKSTRISNEMLGVLLPYIKDFLKRK